MSELYAVNRLIATPPSETETLRRKPIKPRKPIKQHKSAIGWPYTAFTWTVADDREAPLFVAIDGRSL